MQLVVFTVVALSAMLVAYAFGLGGAVGFLIFLAILFVGVSVRVSQPLIERLLIRSACRLTARYRPAVRVGVLTGGGDCPGLNAAIRAIVRKGIDHYGHAIVGFRDGWRGPLENLHEELTVECTRGILPRGGTILGTSRTNPFKRENGPERVRETMETLHLDGLIAIGGEDTLGAAARLHERPRAAGARRAEDDRQRPRRHRRDLRLRHRPPGGDRGDRPPPHDRRVAPPGDGGRGDGPARRVDRAPFRASPAAAT